MAFTATKVFNTVLGDKIVGCYSLATDGSDTTWSAPVKIIETAWVQYPALPAATSTSLSGDWPDIRPAQTSRAMTWATNVVTFGSAPMTGQTLYVFYIGY